jgi:adenylate kinase
LNSQKNVFIFIGPPGAGKGSLSQQCIATLGWKQLSTGALCRKHINEKTEIGKKIDFAIKSGKLMSDELIVTMVQDWLAKNEQSFEALILDGFPRTVVQAEALHKLLFEKIDCYKLNIIRLFISDEEVVRRLSGRIVCSNNDCQAVYSRLCQSLEPCQPMTCDWCGGQLVPRDDDSLTAVYDRLKTYHTHEKHLIDFYATHGFVINQVNVEKPLSKIFEEFRVLINNF